METLLYNLISVNKIFLNIKLTFLRSKRTKQMTEEEIFGKVQEVIAQKLNTEKDKIKPDSKIAEDLGADSLDIVEITISLEAAFSTDISDDIEVVYINDLVKYIQGRLEA
jgi:acyl carrier protein